MKFILTIFLTSLVIFMIVLWLNYATYNGPKTNLSKSEYDKKQ